MNQKRFQYQLVTIITLIGLALLVTGCSGTQTQSNAVDQRIISVTGSGQAHGMPDVAFVGLGVDITNQDIGVAVDQANSSIQDVTSALEELGIDPEDIQTTNLNVWQNEPSKPSEPGIETDTPEYEVNYTIQVKVRDIDRISEVIQAGLDAGANRVNGLRFGLDNSADLESQARANAVEDARGRAKELAENLGVQLGDPIYISEGNTIGRPQSPAIEAAAPTSGIGGGPSISEGQLSVTIQVNVVFAYSP